MYWAAYVCTGLPMYVLGCLCMYWAAYVCTGLPMYVLGCLCMYWAAYVPVAIKGSSCGGGSYAGRDLRLQLIKLSIGCVKGFLRVLPY